MGVRPTLLTSSHQLRSAAESAETQALIVDSMIDPASVVGSSQTDLAAAAPPKRCMTNGCRLEMASSRSLRSSLTSFAFISAAPLFLQSTLRVSYLSTVCLLLATPEEKPVSALK